MALAYTRRQDQHAGRHGRNVPDRTFGPSACGSWQAREMTGLAVLGVSSGGGVLLVLGFGQAALAALPHPGPRALHLIELGAGGVVMLIALALALMRDRVSSGVLNRRPATTGASLLLGAGIAAVEL